MMVTNKPEVFTPVDNLKLGYQEETEVKSRCIHSLQSFTHFPLSLSLFLQDHPNNVTLTDFQPKNSNEVDQPSSTEVVATGDSCGSSVPSSSEKEDFEFRQEDKP